MNGLKDWAMEVNYNSSRKSRIQQEKEDVRDETIDCHALTITKILKRLNDLESIVQTQDNLLEEQILIIKNNNERICMLERIVEEQRELFYETNDKILIEQVKTHSIESIVCSQKQSLGDKINIIDERISYVEFDKIKDEIFYASACVLADVLDKSVRSNGDFDCFRESNYVQVINFVEKVAKIIDKEWNIAEFTKVSNELFIKSSKIDKRVQYKQVYRKSYHESSMNLMKLLGVLQSTPSKVRKMFVNEEKILRSYDFLKPLFNTVYSIVNSPNEEFMYRK